MNESLSLQEGEKLSVTYRVEPGCLGPEGINHIAKFCDFSQVQLQTLDADYVIWNIVPRTDKSLPEMDYCVVGKKISFSQAEKYLALLDQSLEDFEGRLSDRLASLIDEFMGY
jgi:hypothetical protein